MSNYTTTLLAAVMKEVFEDKPLVSMAYDAKQRQLLTAIPKGEAAGKYTVVPALVEDSQGLGPTFATAQSNITAANLVAFDVTTVKNYSIARVDGDAIALTKGNRGALVDAVTLAMKSAINGLGNIIETALFRTAGGALGTVVETSGTTATMGTSLRDINNFSAGMKIIFAADESSAARDSAEAVTVSSVNRVAGSMVVSANLNTISGITTLDSIFREGSYTAAGTSALNISGLSAWCPATAPTTTLFGVTRTTDTRLGGFRYTGTGMAIEEALINGASLLAENGSGAPDTVLISFSDFRTLIAELGSKVTRSAGKLGSAGFSAVEVFGPKGVMEIMPCVKCPAGHAWIVEMAQLRLLATGEVMRVLDEDGQEWTKVYNEDSYELRIGFYGNLAVYNTASICHVIL